MSSKISMENTEHQSLTDEWRSHRETAPSFMREEEPTVPRWVGLVGLMLVTLGSMALVMAAIGRGSMVSPTWGTLFTVVGLACLLYHATRDAELQVRRTYGLLGYLFLAAGILVTVLPGKGQQAGDNFLPYGFTFLMLALFFLLPFARNETNPGWQRIVLAVLGLVGTALAVTGFVGGSINISFLIPYGLVLAVLGLAYLWAFVGLRGISDDVGYRVGLAIGAAGLLVFLVALGRSLFQTYLIPSGLLLMGLGLLYAIFSAGLCSDNRLVVLTRRELASFFYSPIAYLILFSLTIVGWWLYFKFVGVVVTATQLGEPLIEPIVRYYIIDWFPVICASLVVVPALTMRLLSEEQRTGTLEVLLTAPVDEIWVVLSKFLAVLIFYMVLWLPWGLFLVALRGPNGETFDYRPLLSFFIALFASGAGFLSMGLFFSSLTRNQIISFMLTFVGMLALLMIFFIRRDVESSAWKNVLSYASYIELWINSLEGKLSPRYLIFHLSAAVFWLFLTVKFMESRRWK
jgi:ABC-type transport system involved in multi-copper enzyme maturation permease subunit